MNRKNKILYENVIREFKTKTRNKKKYILYMRDNNFLFMLHFCFKQQVKAFYCYKYELRYSK